MENISLNADSFATDLTVSATNQQTVEHDLTGNLNNLKILIQNGVIPLEQGQNYAMNLMKNYFQPTIQDVNQNLPLQTLSLQSGASSENTNTSSPINREISQNISGNREDTLFALINGIAEQAINKYRQQIEHDKFLNTQNENSKRRLTSNAQNFVTETKSTRTFTREEIGKMSTKEFLENEGAIMEQLRKGHIK